MDLKRKFARASALAALTLASLMSTAHAAELIKVRLGMLPIIPLAPVFLGKEQGYFEEEGIDIEMRMFQGGPEITAAVISDDIDYGFSSTISPLLAFAQGAPLRIVAANENADDAVVTGILGKKDTAIKGLKDLEGKRVAVNALKAILELVVREGVQRDRGDPNKVVFVEAPFPQMGALLTSGQVDAVVNVEPFIMMMVENDAKVIENAFLVIKDGPMGIWFSTERRAKDRDMLERFRRVIKKSNIYARNHPDEVRRIIQTYTRISPEAAQKIALPAWTPDLDAQTIQHQIDMLERHKFLRKAFAANDILVE